MKGILKKTAILGVIIAMGFSGYQLATAQYYTTTTSNASYYGYGGGGGYGGNYDYYGGIGSYTIGCTTYYYSTRTHRQLYTQNICSTTYQNNYPYYNYYNQYYPWYNTGWTNTNYGYGYGYGNCYYHTNNQMVCYQ